MNKVVFILSLLIVVLTSCEGLEIENIRFYEGQPNNAKMLKSMPKKLVGYYTDELGNTARIKDNIIIEYNKAGTVEKYSALSDSFMLKKVGRDFILNTKLSDSIWLCQVLRITNEKLSFYSLKDSSLYSSNIQIQNLTYNKKEWKSIIDNNLLKLENSWLKRDY